jgi:hypothetical protein
MWPEKKAEVRTAGSKMAIETPLKSMINPAYGVQRSYSAPSRSMPQGARAEQTPKPRWYGHPVVTKLSVERPLVNIIGPGSPTPGGYYAPAPGPQKRVTARIPAYTEHVTGIDANGVTKVKPGAVNWHKTFDDARTASTDTGKPVLMFAMIGNLDDKFC